MRILCLILFLINGHMVTGQHVYQAFVRDEGSNEPLRYANVYIESLNTGAATDETGYVEIINIPDGTYTIQFSYMGYEPKKVQKTFPLKFNEEKEIIFLEPLEIYMDKVVITATRYNGVVSDTPVRVEVLGQKEVNEEIAIRPGNVSKLLGETSGIQVQQTSAVSGNVRFRLQGLPGHYTQLLKDGFPTYNGFSSGLSLLQIPPLDLEQVEVIKGSLSALYGEGAIAGIVNLVSKIPGSENELSVVLNQTHKEGRDISAYFSSRQEKTGLTFLASQSLQHVIDVNNDGFSDIPGFRQVTLNPRFFYYFDDATTLTVGVSSFFEDREGGDIRAIEKGVDSTHTFIENNKSSRLTSQFKLTKNYENGNVFTLKNSIGYFERGITSYNSFFSGKQVYSYSELSFLIKSSAHSLVCGFNYNTDLFQQNDNAQLKLFDYRYHTIGGFVIDNWVVSSKIMIQPGLRLDYQNQFHTFVLPHFACLYKISEKFSTRLSGGFGYEIPDLLSSVCEDDIFSGQYTGSVDLKAETSKGLNLDFSYRFFLDDFFVSMNQAFFYTYVKNALIPQYQTIDSEKESFDNTDLSLLSRGIDVNLILGLDELILFADYTYTDIQKTNSGVQSFLELTPKHKLNLTLTFENKKSWRTGIEAFYTGSQYLGDDRYSRNYWVFGIMFEKLFKNFSIIGNIENLFDERQTRYEPLLLSMTDRPVFNSIYTPLEGIVGNIALKFELH